MQALRLETQNDVLLFDGSMRLTSFCSKAAPEQNFIKFDEAHPAFDIGYLNERKEYHILSALKATQVSVTQNGGVITGSFSGFPGSKLAVKCTVQADGRFAKFGITVDAGGLDIVDVQYPFVVCPYKLDDSGTEAICLPHGYGSGRLITGELEFADHALSNRFPVDYYQPWEFASHEGNCNHYPGMMYAQYMAYYNDKAGLYMACNDTEANVKRFKILHRRPGFRFGVSHVGDWPQNGSRTLEYDIQMTSFQGDWYDATDIYREWSMEQKWFVPLVKKDNVPEWLLDSPAYITIRSGGILDTGDVYPIPEFVPYEKCLPLLEEVSKKIGAPLSIILMGWEHAGSWVYPDCFPPVGGEESMNAFIKALRARGWHAGSFCSGTRWAFDQPWNGYDGRDEVFAMGALEGACREIDGRPWSDWGYNFRNSYAGCLGTDKTRDMSLGIVDHLIDWGMDCLQFLDQNNGGSTFPCFAEDHDHPNKPGKWMYEKMKSFVEEMHQIATDKNLPGVIHSAESGLNETCIPFFQQTELRVYPDDYGSGTIPIYQYLFHECIVLQGMMGNAPEPYHMAIRNAVNCVLGGIPGGVLKGDGTFLDRDTNNWAVWEPHFENPQDAFDMMRTVLALRRGPAKPYLVTGRMMRPANVQNIARKEWDFKGKKRDYATVFHTAWMNPANNKHAVVLANWTDAEESIQLTDARLGGQVKVYTAGDALTDAAVAYKDSMTVRVPAHGCVLVEQG